MSSPHHFKNSFTLLPPFIHSPESQQQLHVVTSSGPSTVQSLTKAFSLSTTSATALRTTRPQTNHPNRHENKVTTRGLFGGLTDRTVPKAAILSIVSTTTLRKQTSELRLFVLGFLKSNFLTGAFINNKGRARGGRDTDRWLTGCELSGDG